jgi:hypothetical protein
MDGSFLFLNAPSLLLSVKVVHFGKTLFIMAHVLSPPKWIFNCCRAKAWKFELDISRALRHGP